MTAFPYNAADTTDDISGTGELLDRWTMVGNLSSIRAAGSGTIPLFQRPAGKFASSCVDALPAPCVAAAAAEPNGPGVTTGTAMLNSLVCYMKGGTVIVPPAQGTYGNMARDTLRGKPFHDSDLSLLKNWKSKARYSAQFWAEVFNVLNRTSYIAPTANPGAPTSFGQSAGTTNGSSPVIGSGGPCEIQLGVKFIF